MARMALMAPKRAQEERNALCGLFTWYAPFKVAVNRVQKCRFGRGRATYSLVRRWLIGLALAIRADWIFANA